MLDTAAVRNVVETTDPFDILINNAGTNRPKTMSETTEDDFDAVLDLNLRAAYFVAQAVTDTMLAAKIPGSIINISSQMGHVGGPLRTVYCSSKWAIEGLTKSLAMELGSARHSREQYRTDLYRDTPCEGNVERPRVPRSGALENQAQPNRPGRGSDGCHRLPCIRCRRHDYRRLSARRWRLDHWMNWTIPRGTTVRS